MRTRHDTRIAEALITAARDLQRQGWEPMQQATSAGLHGDWATVSNALHGLRGAAGRFDDGSFMRAALLTEHAVRAGRHAELPELLANAGQHYREVLARIETWLGQQPEIPEPPMERQAGSVGKQDLEKLLSQLEDQAFAALDEFKRLRPALADMSPAETDIIASLLDGLDFQHAAARLRNLLET